MNPTVLGWGELLDLYGPLSVTIEVHPGGGTIHALVITKLQGDGTPGGTFVTYIDPDGGVIHPGVPFLDFLKRYEGAHTWPLQVIYMDP